MLIGKQFSIWKKRNATSSSDCQYFAGVVHISTPTTDCLFRRTTNIIKQMYRGEKKIFNWQNHDKYPPTHTIHLLNISSVSQVSKCFPSTTNQSYLKHSNVRDQLYFPGRYQKQHLFPASIPDLSQIKLFKHTINGMQLHSICLPTGSQRGRAVLADHYHHHPA